MIYLQCLEKLLMLKLYSIEQMTYGEFILSIPQITSLNTLSIKPLDGRIVIECNPAISHKIIAEFLVLVLLIQVIILIEN